MNQTPTLRNRKKTLISIKAMDKNAKSLSEIQSVMALCHASGVKYRLLSSMDEYSFRRAMSEEFNQVDQFFNQRII